MCIFNKNRRIITSILLSKGVLLDTKLQATAYTMHFNSEERLHFSLTVQEEEAASLSKIM
jgi:hypothetical protein